VCSKARPAENGCARRFRYAGYVAGFSQIASMKLWLCAKSPAVERRHAAPQQREETPIDCLSVLYPISSDGRIFCDYYSAERKGLLKRQDVDPRQMRIGVDIFCRRLVRRMKRERVGNCPSLRDGPRPGLV
jgi:hypothetical protein